MKPTAAERCHAHAKHSHQISLVKPSPWRMPRLTEKLGARKCYVNPKRSALRACDV